MQGAWRRQTACLLNSSHLQARGLVTAAQAFVCSAAQLAAQAAVFGPGQWLTAAAAGSSASATAVRATGRAPYMQHGASAARQRRAAHEPPRAGTQGRIHPVLCIRARVLKPCQRLPCRIMPRMQQHSLRGCSCHAALQHSLCCSAAGWLMAWQGQRCSMLHARRCIIHLCMTC